MAIALANPIYDSVFKYLMEDLDIAREIVSAIIDKEIIQIAVQSQENSVPIKNATGLFTVYRLDFVAQIKEVDGTERKILIELQKAKYSTDIIRFRRYLGEQYKKDTLPITTIYFLGYTFDDELPAVIEVERLYKDRLNGQLLEKRNEFIESLTHSSYVIQIKKLHTTLKSKLERILSVFEQGRLSSDNRIVYYEYLIEDELQKMITRRLNYAASDEQIKREMEVEEEIMEALQDLERKAEKLSEVVREKDKVIGEKDKALGENQKVLEEKDKVIGENQKVLEEKDKVIGENQKVLEEKDKIIRELMEKLKSSQ